MFGVEGVGNSTFLVYKTEEEKIDKLGLGMLGNNTIEGFLKFSCVWKDETGILNYDITTMIPLRQYFENYLSMDQVIHIFCSIARGVAAAEEYMLDTGKLMLDSRYIYIEVNSGNCRLLYLPVKEMGLEQNLTEALKKLLLEIRYDVRDDNTYMTEMINYFNENRNLDGRKFEQWLSKLSMKEEKAEEAVHKEMLLRREAQSGRDMTAGWEQEGERKEGMETALFDTVPPAMQNTMHMEDRNGQGEKKKGFFLNLGGKKEKEEGKKESRRQEKRQEKEEKKQKKLFEKQRKKAEKQGEKNKKSGKTDGINPYFAIPNQEGQEAPAVKMEIPGEPQKNLDAGVPEAQGNMGGMAHKAQAERIPGGAALDFGDTVITRGEEDSSTVILSSQMRIENGIPYLRRTKNGQKMYVDKPVMKIGREGSYVDFYIGDNPSVSRSHADIIREDGIYYIRDNNSSNHTFVGTEMLVGGRKVKLEHGAKIRLADEEFVFYMY